MTNSSTENGAAVVAPVGTTGNAARAAHRLANARAAVADKLSPISPFAYARVIVAKKALSELSKLGTQDRDHAERLTTMLRYCTSVADSFDQQRDAFTWFYAESEDGQIVTREADVPNPDGKGTTKQQVPVLKNEPEFNLLMNDLMRDDASKNVDLGTPPKPFTYKELRVKTWGTKPSPDLIARLGPFVDMTAKADSDD